MEHLLPEHRLGGHRRGHRVTVTLPKVVRRLTRVVENQHVHGIVRDEDVEGQHGAGSVHAEVDVEA